jgi:GntR family transcriptional regulator
MVFTDTLRIESSGVPIYVQIRDQLLGAIGAGVLKPGERMPTMRQVAVALKVDLNTVRRAYDAAQEAGAIVMVKARGTFVAEAPPPIDPESRVEQIDRLAHQTIAIATAAGIAPRDVADRMTALLKGSLT